MLTEFVSSHSVVISATLLILAYIFIALEKIPKVTIALVGGAITIVLGLVSQVKTVNGVINPHYFINYVDFNVIFLLVSMMIIVAITTRSGVFIYIRLIYGSSECIFGQRYNCNSYYANNICYCSQIIN